MKTYIESQFAPLLRLFHSRELNNKINNVLHQEHYDSFIMMTLPHLKSFLRMIILQFQYTIEIYNIWPLSYSTPNLVVLLFS